MTTPPATLDLSSLTMLTGGAVERYVLARLRAEGDPQTRTSHGYVFQHLIQDQPTIGELAVRLKMTQQGASKAVAELEGLGYVERVAQVGDGRVRRTTLTPRGRAVIDQARQIRAELELAMTGRIGADRLERLKEDLATLLDIVGGSDQVRRRSVPLPEGTVG